MNALRITNKNYSIAGSSGLILKLYHMTDVIGVAGIHDIQMMKISVKGMLGKGIYFAETPEQASDKAEHKGILLEVLVRVGRMIVLTREWNHALTLDMIREVGCDSVKSVLHNTGPEYVVYDPDQVIAAWAISGMPDLPQVIFPGPEWDNRDVCMYDGKCTCHDPLHFVRYKHLHPPVFPMKHPKPVQSPLCPAGARCTDKTIAHFGEYSHPATVTLPILPKMIVPKSYRTKPQEAIEILVRGIYNDDGEEGEYGRYKDECPYGAECPYLDNLDHFTRFRHPRSAIFMAQCEKGERCTDMSSEHRRECLHKKVCIYGAECQFVDNTEHYLEFAHPMETVVKIPCARGLRCTDRSVEHLKFYSHKKY